MIIEKDRNILQPPPTNDTDVPPPYDSTTTFTRQYSNQGNHSTQRASQPPTRPSDEKARLATPTSPSRSSSTTSGNLASPALPVTPRSPAGWLGNLLGTAQARTDKEIKNTVLGLLRDLVKQSDSTSAVAILQSCAEACLSRGLSFESIVQEPSIQGHTPLYWAIIKNSLSSPDQASSTPLAPTLFHLLISFPLTKETYNDALQACLLTSSHDTFLLLRTCDPSRTEDIVSFDTNPNGDEPTILHGPAGPDVILVSNGDDQSDLEESAMSGAFRVQIQLREFQRRMRIQGEVKVEFIARGRMWALTFLVYSSSLDYPVNFGRDLRNGTWIILLDLVQNSPPTWIDSRLTITVPSPPPSADTPQPYYSSANPFSFAVAAPRGASSAGHKSRTSPIVIRFRSPGSHQLSGELKDKLKSWDNSRGPVMSSLSAHPQGSSLQHDGCPYIQPDGSLHLLLEAKLIKPGNDCVFM